MEHVALLTNKIENRENAIKTITDINMNNIE